MPILVYSVGWRLFNSLYVNLSYLYVMFLAELSIKKKCIIFAQFGVSNVNMYMRHLNMVWGGEDDDVDKKCSLNLLDNNYKCINLVK